jgi:hypothetical protein
MPISFNIESWRDIGDNSTTKAYQFQTISNLYNSGIPNEVISLQLDITEEVEKTIEKIKKEQESIMVWSAGTAYDTSA